jgi:uncharacterized phage-associated protein
MLYLADRHTLIDIGQPITGDRAVSMPNGPVLSQVLDFINMGEEPEESAPGGYWFSAISEPHNYMVELRCSEPDDDELSDYEIGVLKRIAEMYGQLDRWALRDFSHTLPEWKDPQSSSVTIAPEDILRAAGKSDDEIERVAAEAQSLLFMKKLIPTFS